MVPAEISRIDIIISYVMPIVNGLMKGYCFYRFVSPFMISKDVVNRNCVSEHSKLSLLNPWTVALMPNCVSGKMGAACGSAAYFLTILLLYTMRLSMDIYVIYGLASLAMFLVICQMDQRNYKQKLFLVVTFFSLNWFAASIAEILYDFLYNSAMQTNYIQNHPELSSVVYIIMCICDLGIEFVFTTIEIWQVMRVYSNKREEMEKKELVMLVLPSIMGVIGYEIMRYYRMFYVLNTGKLEKTYDRLTLLFCVVSSITIIVVIMLYQGIKAKQKEAQQAKLLVTQIDSIRRHIEQVEDLYHHIRSIKHDMTNHILTLEKLYEGSKIEEAERYSKNIKMELAQMTGEIESGNPVTNVILQEFAKEAENRGILFHSEYYYPVDSNIDAFDISVIVNNGLQNAMEHASGGKEKRISIVSYQRNNAYIIEICNSFIGTLQWDPESGLPLTSKEKTDGHGYGLLNIRCVTEKYAGDLDITLKDGEFCLCIMLMIE